MDPAGNATTLVTFDGSTEAGPGFTGTGTVFTVGTDGTGYHLLHGFTGGRDGANPDGVVADRAGVIFGTTKGGVCGTMVRLGR